MTDLNDLKILNCILDAESRSSDNKNAYMGVLMPFELFEQVYIKESGKPEEFGGVLVHYVHHRLGRAPINPYITVTGGTWEDWEKYVGPELMKEWDENTEDWKNA